MRSVSLSIPASTDLAARDGGFGLYVHWPFCQSKCPYCDFNSHVRAEIPQDRWRRALVAEIEAFAAWAPKRPLDTIFFGGGTPSLMPAETVEAIIDAARRAWGFANQIEITLEANPGSVEASRFRAYADAGVNRTSLGVQALNDADLKFLGRLHTAAEARAALDIAKTVFERTSFDLIYARPGQTLDAWRSELETALSLAGDHLSLYQLTIEPGTAFHGLHARGAFVVPEEDAAADLFEFTQERMIEAGMPAYEISNHARPGAESRHNLIYWRQGAWVGVGPGAHGRFAKAGQRTAFRQTRTPEAWLRGVEEKGMGLAEAAALPMEDIAGEALMMGLRLSEGVDRERFRALTSRDVADWVNQDGLRKLQAEEFVALSEDRLIATATGRQRLNAVLGLLLPG